MVGPYLFIAFCCILLINLMKKNSHKSRFSIGIPAFKSKFLKECILSILSQTYTNFELIIVNDCSPEPLGDIIKQFDDERIKYFVNETNTGALNVVNNWNKCLNEADGEFFVLMGDDDSMEPDYLEEFDKLIQKYPDLDVYHCRTRLINEDSKPIMLTPSWPEYESVYENIWHRINSFRVQYISDFVYRTDALNERGGFFYLPLAWFSDDVSAYIASGDKGIAHTNKPVFNYRVNSLTISSTGNNEMKMEAIMQLNTWFNVFLAKKPSSAQDALVHENISKGLKKYLQKKKINTIVYSLNKNILSSAYKWYKLRKKYRFTVNELLLAVFEHFKRKKVKEKFSSAQ